jgi:hypothetical protein
MPTRLWNAATSCGMAVIGMRWAITARTAADGHAHNDQTGADAKDGVASNKVVTMAMPIPAMPK